MFDILQTEKTEKRKIRKGRTVKSIKTVSVGQGEYFRIITAAESRTGIPWNEITQTACGRILLPYDVKEKEKCPCAVEVSDSLERRVFMNTVEKILRHMHENRIFTSVYLVCGEDDFARLLPYLGCAKEFFMCDGNDSDFFRRQMMKNYGISVRSLHDGGNYPKGFAADAVNMSVSVDGSIFYPWKFAENDFRLAHCPENVCRADFLYALYEYCGCRELDRLTYSSFLCSGKGVSLDDLLTLTEKLKT